MFPHTKACNISTVNLSAQQVKEKDSEIGIGQTSIVIYRYELIEYLPWIYGYRFVVLSKKPEAAVTFDTLTNPFDKYLWYFTSSFSIAVFACLTLIQKCWNYASGQKTQHGWIFEGKILFHLPLMACFIYIFQTSFLL